MNRATGDGSEDEMAAVRQHIEVLAGGEPEAMAELTGLLVDSLRRSTAGLLAAVEAGALQRAAEYAHRLRGAAAMAGLTTIAAQADRIEHAGVSAEALPQAAAQLGALVERAIAAVSAA